jgi:protein farnesyltransferase/geranylgeranyltransferase type-1 subunit alpha
MEEIIPIPQDDGPNPVVPIAYPPEYTRLMNLFRGLVKTKELSQRGLDLMKDIIEYNPAHYTIWAYRLQTILHLQSDFAEELEWIEELLYENPKSYQIWHYRQNIIENYGMILGISQEKR